MAGRIALGRVHTPTFEGDRMQAQARSASVKANDLETRIAVLELLIPVSIMLTANITTAVATATNTLLRFDVKAGETWDLDYFGYAGCSSTAGMKYAISCPTRSTLSGELETSSTNTSVTNWSTQTLSASTLSTACHAGASSAARPDRINARIKTGEAGSIILQFASVTAATTTTLYAKSYLRAFRVAEV